MEDVKFSIITRFTITNYTLPVPTQRLKSGIVDGSSCSHNSTHTGNITLCCIALKTGKRLALSTLLMANIGESCLLLHRYNRFRQNLYQ